MVTLRLSVMVCWKESLIPDSTVYKETSAWNVTHVLIGLECRLLSVMVCWKKRVIPKSTVYKQTSTWNITHVFLGLGCRNWRLLI